MPVTEAAVKDFLDKLSAARPITSRKMFGGVGIYCDGVFFAVIDDDRLYFKVDEHNLPKYDSSRAVQWLIQGPEPQAMPYREVPANIVNGPDLGEWIDDAVQVALRKKKK
jgi:DNA transformation protein